MVVIWVSVVLLLRFLSKLAEGTESGGLAHCLDAIVVRGGAEYEHGASRRIPESRYHY